MRILLTALLGATLLAGCLPDSNQDAVTSADASAGKRSGVQYSDTLGNIALQIQNAVTSDSNWFHNLSNGQALDLADYGINTDSGNNVLSIGAPIAVHLCPTATNSVVQISWLDAHDGTPDRNFKLRGFGTDAGSIEAALKARVSSNQVGHVESSGTIRMADNSTLAIPASCNTLSVPKGAPVLAFTIDKPARPTQTMTRVEYRTESCGKGANNEAMHGTSVLSREVSFAPDGDITYGAWRTENMGQCIEDVNVAVVKRTNSTDGASTLLDNFANTSLRNTLEDQLKMGCVKLEIESDYTGKSRYTPKKIRKINTCVQSTVTADDTIKDKDVGDGVDTRIVQCDGSKMLYKVVFENLPGTNGTDGKGKDTITWTSGTGTLIRDVDKHVTGGNDNSGKGQWKGAAISCRGNEVFDVACHKIPKTPETGPRNSNEKFVRKNIGSWFSGRNWFDRIFGICWFGCKSITGGYIETINPKYFTGGQRIENAGTTTHRLVQALTWDTSDKQFFTPNVTPATLWKIKRNECLWSERHMTADCPLIYDASQQGEKPTKTLSQFADKPIALNPGISVAASISGDMYNKMMDAALERDISADSGNYRKCNSKGCTVMADVLKEGKSYKNQFPSEVAVDWKKCNIKGCDRWTERSGPGRNAYIKSWEGTSSIGKDLVLITESARTLRSDMCLDVKLKLDAVGAAEEAAAEAEAARGVVLKAEQDVTIAEAKAVAAHKKADDLKAAADALPATPEDKKKAAIAKAKAAAEEAETADTAVTAAKKVLAKAKAEADRLEAAAKKAEEIAKAGGKPNLKPEERKMLENARDEMCKSEANTLTLDEQDATLSICVSHYKNPKLINLESMTLYCDAVFDKTKEGDLTFKKNLPPEGFSVQTTLLNTDGVDYAMKPELALNRKLIIGHDGFITPLHCGRTEQKYHGWTVRIFYKTCSWKHGCKIKSYDTETTVAESVVREWKGHSYATGEWTVPKRGFYWDAPDGKRWKWDEKKDIDKVLIYNPYGKSSDHK